MELICKDCGNIESCYLEAVDCDTPKFCPWTGKSCNWKGE
jgi:hypothetical protein